MNQNDFELWKTQCELSSLNKILLRGHHLRELYRYYQEKDKYRYLEDIMTHPYVVRYGFHFGRAVLTIFQKIVFDPNIEIEFVEGLDGICNVCEKRDDSCLRKSLMREDKAELAKYGLKLGKRYLSKDLIQYFDEIIPM